ncbi:MAG: hypothetical protein JRJ66_11510 [Deltaproteobacteria bacterium]|nr:hypothetical protein [Deltaproteobacteria bacterium]
MLDTIRSRGFLEGDTEKGFLGAQFSLEQDENMRPGLKPVSVIVLGAGERGKIYADYALTHPDRIKVVGVAEPRRRQRMNMVEAHRHGDVGRHSVNVATRPVERSQALLGEGRIKWIIAKQDSIKQKNRLRIGIHPPFLF